jgi:hypothetical protein
VGEGGGGMDLTTVNLTGIKHNVHWYSECNAGTRWRSWLMHFSTGWKVAGSIPDGITGKFSLK